MTMKPIRNIRRRLVLAAFTLATVIATIFGTGLYLAFEYAEDEFGDEHMLGDIDAFMRAYDAFPGVAEIPRENIDVYIVADGDKSSLPDYVRNAPPGTDEVFIDGVEYELQKRTRGTTEFYFVIDEREFEAFEQTLMFTMFTIIVLVVAASAWAGQLVADRIIQPLTNLSHQVAGMGDQAGQRIVPDPNAGPGDEIAQLGNAIAGYHERISELLRREREFSADVSHELRNPIMAVQGAAELLAKHVDSKGAQDLVSRIRRSCFHMTTLTEALLYLARDPESFRDMVEPVSIKRVVDVQIAAVRDVVERKGITVTVQQTTDSTVNTIPAVIEIVIGNILHNAVKYTNQNVINIFVGDSEIVIQDYGPGIDRTAQQTLFDRFNRGQNRNPDGSGIGLALVRRFCEQYGWTIDFRSDLDSGTRVAVAF
tara:strand:- start:6815 stop:8089 length:1275 start_codon:yes stop_codon:yes gene_type:complete